MTDFKVTTTVTTGRMIFEFEDATKNDSERYELVELSIYEDFLSTSFADHGVVLKQDETYCMSYTLVMCQGNEELVQDAAIWLEKTMLSKYGCFLESVDTV